MKFPFPFKATEITSTTTTSAGPSWPWPTCATGPKTLSFRANTSDDNIYKTINSAYLDDKNSTTELPNATPDSFFSICNSFEHHHEELILPFESESSNLDEQLNNVESAVVSGLRSERLFFEPGETNSILEEAKTHESLHKENVAMMAIDSSDPFLDFRASMEEMVAAHGMKDWESLEELLECYLRVNDRSNHGYIVEAFMDMLIHLALITVSNDENCSSSSTTTQCSFTSPLSFSSSSTTYSSTSPCLSSLENEDEIEKNGDSTSSSSLSYNASSSGV